jgi:ring-1,2-phenylacetyl-CoA epoxidase subunit PaaD
MTAAADLTAVRVAIDLVEDPEVPITLVDLGVVRSVEASDGYVRVVLRPTRIGCPGRDEMARRIRVAATAAAPGVEVRIDWEVSGWDAREVSPRGTQALLQIGYAAPGVTDVACPYCGSHDVRSGGAFGGSVCKTPFSCRACGSAFDVLKSNNAGGHR